MSWPDMITIQGSKEQLQATRDIDGLAIYDHGQHQIDDDLYEVVADGTPEAIAALQSRGLKVATVLTGDERQRQAGDGGQS